MMKISMKNIALSTLALSTASLLFTAVQASDLPERGPIPFTAYDTDKNAMVSEDEFYGARAKRMQQRAKDGYPMRRAGSAPDFSEFDTNKDGQLTEEELKDGQARQMQKRRGTGMGQGQN